MFFLTFPHENLNQIHAFQVRSLKKNLIDRNLGTQCKLLVGDENI